MSSHWKGLDVPMKNPKTETHEISYEHAVKIVRRHIDYNCLNLKQDDFDFDSIPSGIIESTTAADRVEIIRHASRHDGTLTFYYDAVCALMMQAYLQEPEQITLIHVEETSDQDLAMYVRQVMMIGMLNPKKTGQEAQEAGEALNARGPQGPLKQYEHGVYMHGVSAQDQVEWFPFEREQQS